MYRKETSLPSRLAALAATRPESAPHPASIAAALIQMELATAAAMDVTAATPSPPLRALAAAVVPWKDRRMLLPNKLVALAARALESVLQDVMPAAVESRDVTAAWTDVTAVMASTTLVSLCWVQTMSSPPVHARRGRHASRSKPFTRESPFRSFRREESSYII
jgi:hypothetical protein